LGAQTQFREEREGNTHETASDFTEQPRDLVEHHTEFGQSGKRDNQELIRPSKTVDRKAPSMPGCH